MSYDNINANSPWSPERVAFAAKLWSEGYSATQIARKLWIEYQITVSRNSVIGILNRRNLAGRNAPSRPTTYSDRPPSRAKVAKPKIFRKVRIAGNGQTFAEPKARAPRVVVPFRQEASGTRTILTVGAGECRWPCGEPSDDSFALCGQDAPDGPYCQHHTSLAYQPPTPNQARGAHALARSLRRFV